MSRNRHHRVARQGLAAALLLAVALVGGACAPETSGGTSPIPGTSEQTAVVVPADSADLTVALTVLELGGGSTEFSAETAIAAGADPAVATEIAEGRDGAMDAAARCAGRNGVRTYSSWWQGTVTVVMLNSCNANRLANALWVGAGIATLVGILSVAGAVPAGIAGAVLAIGAGAIGWCTSNGTGLEIHKAYYGSWCTNQ